MILFRRVFEARLLGHFPGGVRDDEQTRLPVALPLCDIVLFALFTLLVPFREWTINKLSLASTVGAKEDTCNAKGTIQGDTVNHPGILPEPTALKCAVMPSFVRCRKREPIWWILVVF